MLLISIRSTAQSHRSTQATKPPVSADPELIRLQNAQQQTLTSGDPGAIAQTTATLVEHLQQRATARKVTPVSCARSSGAKATRDQLCDLLATYNNDLGAAEARLGRYEPALAHFQEAERWLPPSPTLLLNLGTAAFRLGDFKESARALTIYLQSQQVGGAPLPPQFNRALLMLAMSLFSNGQFAEADKVFASIPELTLRDPRTAYSWAFSLAHSGQQQHANQIVSELAKQALPSDAMSLVCHIYMDTENYEQSAGCFRKLYETDPTVKLAHYQVAESLIRLDRPAEAVPELRQELALNPDNPDVQYSLAFALLQSSHKEEALGILQTLTASHPSHAQAQYQLGKALLEQGDAKSAVTHLELAEQNDPAPDYIHYQLQAAYRKAGRIEDADRELRVYREIKARNREITAPHAQSDHP